MLTLILLSLSFLIGYTLGWYQYKYKRDMKEIEELGTYFKELQEHEKRYGN